MAVMADHQRQLFLKIL